MSSPHVAEMRLVFERLAHASPAEVVGLVAAHPAVLSLNRDRSALQVIGCSGRIFAHVPVEIATAQ